MTKLTPEDVKKLREAATPPPWFNTSQSGEITDAEGYYIGRATGAETRVGRANAKLWVSAHDMADLIERQATDHAENARILGYLVDELQGLIPAGKLAALEECRERSAAYRADREKLK